jgi:hypothetical protein
MTQGQMPLQTLEKKRLALTVTGIDREDMTGVVLSQTRTSAQGFEVTGDILGFLTTTKPVVRPNFLRALSHDDDAR